MSELQKYVVTVPAATSIHRSLVVKARGNEVLFAIRQGMDEAASIVIAPRDARRVREGIGLVLGYPADVLDRCPVPTCRRPDRVSLVPGWSRSDEGIPVVGCGNPWHYLDIDR